MKSKEAPKVTGQPWVEPLTHRPSDMDKAVANRLAAIQIRLDQTQDFEQLHHC